MEKQVSLKSLAVIWCIGIAAIALVLMCSQPKEDYADNHNWIVNHSEIPNENR